MWACVGFCAHVRAHGLFGGGCRAPPPGLCRLPHHTPRHTHHNNKHHTALRARPRYLDVILQALGSAAVLVPPVPPLTRYKREVAVKQVGWVGGCWEMQLRLGWAAPD